MIQDPLNVFIADFCENEEVTFTWLAGSKSCKAIFDNGYVDANIGETVLDTTQPRLTCKHEDVKDVPRESLVTVRGVPYSVVQVQPDGTGFAIVQLAHETE